MTIPLLNVIPTILGSLVVMNIFLNGISFKSSSTVRFSISYRFQDGPCAQNDFIFQIIIDHWVVKGARSGCFRRHIEIVSGVILLVVEAVVVVVGVWGWAYSFSSSFFLDEMDIVCIRIATIMSRCKNPEANTNERKQTNLIK